MSHSKPLNCKKWFCFICGFIYEDENRRIGIFSVPKNRITQWREKIPGLKQTHRLCDIHFDDSVIVKGTRVGQDFYPAERWKLTSLALPTLVTSKVSSLKPTRTPLRQLFTPSNKQIEQQKAIPASAKVTPSELCQVTSQTERQGFKRHSTTSTYSSRKKLCYKSTSSNEQPAAVEEVNSDFVNTVSLDIHPSSQSQDLSSNCETPPNEEIIMPLPIPPVDWTQAGEWIVHEGEFGTSSWRSTLNPPEGIVLPQMGNVVLESSMPNQQSGGTVVLGNTVPLTFLDSDHLGHCSDSTSTTNVAPIAAPEGDTASKDDLPPILPKRRRKKRVITPLTNCLRCKTEIKGQCSHCKIKELKMIIKEKDKLLRRKDKLLEKKDKQLKIAQTETKYVERRLEDRLKAYRKKLNTSKRRFTRMGQYAKEVAATIAELKDDVVRLTANQLEARIKHLTHGI